LPFSLIASLSVDHTGYFRGQIKREDLPVTKRLRLGGMINTDLEYSAGTKYLMTKNLALSAHYDSDMGAGAGLTILF
jgi:hypothetical protein